LATASNSEFVFDRSSYEISPLQAALGYKWRILCFAIVVTTLAGVVVKQLPVRYSSSASVLVDARKLQVIDAQSVLSSPTLDLDRLRTYMEQLRSTVVTQAVVDQLDLTHDPDYCRLPSPLDRMQGEVMRWVGPYLPASLQASNTPAPTRSCNLTVDEATEHLLSVVSGSNDNRSYIIKISAEASTSERAAQIANTYARAYVESLRRQTSDAAEQADAWLTTYLSNLRTQTQAADAAVEKFRRQNQLTPVRGETIIAQRLSELNSQLTVATSALAEKQAALAQVQAASGPGGLGTSSAPAVLASPVIQRLTDKLTELQSNEADLRSRYGSAYPSVQAAAAQTDKVRRTLQLEIGKVIQGLADEVSVLTARKASLTATVQGLQSATGEQGTAGVRLQELQRDADTEHKLYESMLTRLHEVDAERHMQWPDASVAVEARPSPVPSFPRTRMILTGVFMVALGIGVGAAFVLSQMSRVFRDVGHVEGETGARVLGLFPLPPRRSSPKGMVRDQPGSIEAETVFFALANLLSARKAAKVAGGWVVMVTSAVAGEGKSSCAAALGYSAVRAGMSVALLECDVRSPSTGQWLAAKAAASERRDPSATSVLRSDANVPTPPADKSSLHIMPIRSFVGDADRLVASPEVSAVVQALRSQYDLVLIDTPPILAVPDALTLAPLIDDTVLVVDWRKTPRRSVAATMRVLLRANIRITGIILSKVNLRQFARLSTSEGYYARGYAGSELHWATGR
jgi:uncharacterized protein involved in exopolysaccharide biosynthesis/Mrp family chromosome partitioning ATPase